MSTQPSVKKSLAVVELFPNISAGSCRHMFWRTVAFALLALSSYLPLPFPSYFLVTVCQQESVVSVYFTCSVHLFEISLSVSITFQSPIFMFPVSLFIYFLDCPSSLSAWGIKSITASQFWSLSFCCILFSTLIFYEIPMFY